MTEEELLAEYLDEQGIGYELAAEDVRYLQGKRVVVFGAGGTIGSEVARQLADKGVRSIILVDTNENGLLRVKGELEEGFGVKCPQIICALGDVTNKQEMENIFSRHQPEIVFDYANYKSVAMGNLNPEEYVRVNVGGMRNLLDVASSYASVERFVYASSDTAAVPTHVLGRTRRVSELLVQAYATKYTDKQFGVVRY